MAARSCIGRLALMKAMPVPMPASGGRPPLGQSMANGVRREQRTASARSLAGSISCTTPTRQADNTCSRTWNRVLAGSASAETSPLEHSAASARCVRRGDFAEAMEAGAAGVAPRHSGVAAINS